MSKAPEDQVQRMYRYANALIRMQESEYLTREKLGRNYHLQMETAMHFQIIGEAAAALARLDYDLGPTSLLETLLAYETEFRMTTRASTGIFWRTSYSKTYPCSSKI